MCQSPDVETRFKCLSFKLPVWLRQHFHLRLWKEEMGAVKGGIVKQQMKDSFKTAMSEVGFKLAPPEERAPQTPQPSRPVRDLMAVL